MNSEKGIIYLIQPAEWIGTNVYKIGCSRKSSLERCKTGYKIGSRYLYIMECDNPISLEITLKKIFAKKFTLKIGKEFFEGDEQAIKDLFHTTVRNFQLLIDDKKNPITIDDDNFIAIDDNNLITIDDDKHQQITINNEENNYVCERCGYKTERLYDLKKHFLRKKVCNPTLEELNIKELYDKFFVINKQINEIIKTEYKCEYCDKYFTSRQGKFQHKLSCNSKLIMLEKRIEELDKKINKPKKNSIKK